MTPARGAHRRSHRPLWAAVAAAGLLGLSACGSTVALRGQQQANQSVGQPDGSTGPTASTPLDSGAGSSPSGSSGGTTTPGSSGSTGAGSSGTATTGVPVSGSAGGTGPDGATGTTGSAGSQPAAAIEVGFIAGKCSNCAAVLGTAYTAQTYGDQDFEQAMVNGINARGGISGHRIKPVFAVVDTASASWATDFQAACSTFTQDHHVVAVLGYAFAHADNLASCLSRAGVLWINGGYSGGDRQAYTRYRHYFTSGAPSLDVELVVSVSSALEDGWVTPTSKLGILQAGCPEDARAFTNGLVPYLRAHHLNLVSNQTINCVGGASDDGSAAAAIQSAELKMRTDGVDNVIITGIPLIVFAENAESQHWNPHYLTFLGGATYEAYLPADQLANIHAAGWMPLLDLNPSQAPPLTATQRQCKELIRRGGIDVPPSQYNQATIACDGVLMYARGVEQTGGDITPAKVASGLEALGTRYVSAVTVNSGTDLSPSQHAAPNGYRSNEYRTSCKCFQYVGPVRAFPTAG